MITTSLRPSSKVFRQREWNMHDNPIEEAKTDTKATVPYNDETIIWEGRPSQWVNAGNFTFWGILLVASTVFWNLWSHSLHEDYTDLADQAVTVALYAIFSISILSALYAYLSVRYEHTTITMNKIKEAKGITMIFRQELFCEISDIKDINSPPAGILGLLGLSTLIIHTNDDDQPIIKIRAIRDREQLIEKLLPAWRKLRIERKGFFGDR
jgi:membrane protein YdbS with pleckstrin-like domain